MDNQNLRSVARKIERGRLHQERLFLIGVCTAARDDNRVCLLRRKGQRFRWFCGRVLRWFFRRGVFFGSCRQLAGRLVRFRCGRRNRRKPRGQRCPADQLRGRGIDIHAPERGRKRMLPIEICLHLPGKAKMRQLTVLYHKYTRSGRMPENQTVWRLCCLPAARPPLLRSLWVRLRAKIGI